MDGTDNTAEEDPLLYIDSSGHTSIPSSTSTSSMTDDDPERRSFLADDDAGPRKHLLNRSKIDFFGSKRGLWVSHSRLLCLVMVLDLMTVSVQIPSMTAAFQSHGMDLRWQGWVASVHGIISFVVGPMLGRVSDSVGRVAMLRMSCFGSMLGAFGCLTATGRWTFIAARTLPALLKCSLPISQAYIVDVSQGSAERSKNLGMLGASFGVAFVLGPPLGGTAADYDVRLPFVISFLECVLLYFALQFLPEPARKGGGGGGGSGSSGGDAAGGDIDGMTKSETPNVGKGGGGGGGGGGGEDHVAGGGRVDQAEVVTATTTSSVFPSPRTTSSMKRVKSGLLMASSEHGGKAEAPRSAAAAASKGGMKRTRSSLLVAAAENGKAKGFVDATVGEVRGGAGSSGSGGGGGQGLNGRISPGKTRGKTLAPTTVGVAVAGATPAAAPGGGRVGGMVPGGGGGRLSIFRGPGGRQMGWGFHDRFFLVVAEGIYHTSFSPFLTSVLAYPTSTVGMLLSYMGMVSALTNAFLVGELTKRFGERPLMASSLMVLALGWVTWSAVSGSLLSILASLTMAGVGGNVFQTVNKASVAQHAPPELVGTVMGMSAALETFGRSLAGPTSGYLFDAVGARGVPLSCSCAAAYVAMVLTIRGFAAIVRGEEAAGGDGRGEGPHKKRSKIYIKRK